jgi:hypothetical protein
MKRFGYSPVDGKSVDRLVHRAVSIAISQISPRVAQSSHGLRRLDFRSPSIETNPVDIAREESHA